LTRICLTAAVVLLAASCVESPGDRIVTGDGENIVGTIVSIEPGRVIFESGGSVPLPVSGSRVYMRDGASSRGEVTMSDGTLRVLSPYGEVDCPFGSVGAIVWGADGAESLLFDVHARAGWQNTHLEVTPGDFVSVTGAGSVTGRTGTTGPEGSERFSTSSALVPTATNGELVMRIGEDGQPMAVGSSWSGTASEPGELFLAVTRPDDETLGVTGFYTVSITVGEGPGRGSVAVYPAHE
jgi:hypothetical protein